MIKVSRNDGGFHFSDVFRGIGVEQFEFIGGDHLRIGRNTHAQRAQVQFRGNRVLGFFGKDEVNEFLGGFHVRSAAEMCSYLKTQITRQVIDYHRRAKARCRDATVELDGVEIAVPSVVQQTVEAREEAEIRIRSRARVVSGWRCSDRTRAIFEACTVGGRTTAEVAREFGVSPGFVRIIRHRGLAKERAEKKIAQRV